jgi:hypothetical protein
LAVALLVEAVGGILVMGGDVSSNDCWKKLQTKEKDKNHTKVNKIILFILTYPRMNSSPSLHMQFASVNLSCSL